MFITWGLPLDWTAAAQDERTTEGDHMRANWLRKMGVSFLLVMLVVMLGVLLARADIIPVNPSLWTGERATDDASLNSTNLWVSNVPTTNGFEIYWNITQTVNIYHYQYTITGQEDPNNPSQHLTLSGNLRLLFIQTSLTATIDDFSHVLFNGTLVTPTVGIQDGLGYGMLFSGGLLGFGVGPDMVFSFDTTRDPIWGSFGAADGIGAGTIAANLGFGQEPTAADAPEFTSFIPIPDTIPLPPGVWLFGSGLVGLIGLRRLKRIKQTS
jgi:hypothetical protein